MPQSFEEAFPGGFEECVSTLGQGPSVDDPEALCGWLQENGFEAIENASPDSILAGLQVEYVSVVDEPAQDSEWLLAKSADADENDWTPGENQLGETRDVVLLKEEDELSDDEDLSDEDGSDDAPAERKVWAAVLVPGEADANGDLVPEPEIESAAHSYMKNYRKVDADHSLFEGEGTPVESYIVRNGPDEFTTPDGETRSYPEGTWIMGVELEKDAWKRVQNGELTGFSIYGGAASLDPDALLTEKQRKALRRARKSATDADGSPSDEQTPAPPRAELGTRRVSLRMGDERQDLLKELGADALANLAEAIRAYVDENPNSTVENTALSDMFAWAADADLDALDDTVEVGGVEIPIRESEDSDSSEEEEVEEESDEDDEDEGDDEEQAKNDDDGPTMDDDTTELLGEIRDTTEGIAKSVEEHGSRLDDLRSDVEEVQKEVGLLDGEEDDEAEETNDDEAAKTEDEPDPVQELRADMEEAGLLEKSADGDSEEEVVRKGAKSGTSPDDVEKSSGSGDGKVSTSTEGITAAGRVD